MIIVKNINHRKIVLFLIGLFFSAGTAVGIFMTFKYNPSATAPTAATFETAFVSNGKYIFLLWLVGFFSAGVFCVPPACALCGYGYGAACSVFLMQNNEGAFLALSLKYCLFLVSMFITAASSSQISLSCYKIHSSPKAALPREREREITEHVIILFISSLPIVLCSLIDVHLIAALA
ncbi:MAG: hypothetical protein HFE62_00455 [Firmicutes bacterium]|nr:hypothetical protein [Bacillota bacterium]